MKITLTGSLGHIGEPLAKTLIANGHQLTIISSNPEREKSITTMGAKAVIGNLEDVNLLIESFTGADSVFTMVPPNNYFDQDLDLIAYYQRLGEGYAKGIAEANIKRVVNLSTIGGHLDKGNGILRGAHLVEQTLNALPSRVSITHMRPTSFYYNLYGYMETIKSNETIYANHGSKPIPWVSPRDIATAVSEELTNLDSKRSVRYVVSEERTGDETAQILGKALGKPNLKWEIVSDEAMAGSLLSVGMNPDIARGLTEMYAALESGLLAEDYVKNKPHRMGEVTLRDFAEEFTRVYHNNR